MAPSSLRPFFRRCYISAGGDRSDIGLALRKELKAASDNRHRKRLRTVEPGLGAGPPSHCTAESEDTDEAEPPNTGSTEDKRKHEDRVAAQKGETQELHAGKTSARLGNKNKSKLGNRGLRKETLMAPSQ